MEQRSDERLAPRPIEPGPEPAGRRHILIGYLWSHRDRFTEEALSRAASEAGFSADEIADAAGVVAERRRDELAARPVKARVRRTVLAIYGITFLVFAVLFLRPNPNENAFMRGLGPTALGVLGLLMLVALWIGLAFVASRRPPAERAEAAFGVMLAVPVVLLVIVSGLCLVTTAPLIAPLGV
jgi:hypothetical protein